MSSNLWWHADRLSGKAFSKAWIRYTHKQASTNSHIYKQTLKSCKHSRDLFYPTNHLKKANRGLTRAVTFHEVKSIICYIGVFYNHITQCFCHRNIHNSLKNYWKFYQTPAWTVLWFIILDKHLRNPHSPHRILCSYLKNCHRLFVNYKHVVNVKNELSIWPHSHCIDRPVYIGQSRTNISKKINRI